ncbi:MAG: hypothetical protein B1H04_04670 [Planctomycetales bacterium 4484_123]|nr:MAG: hypothetical protein B1H04_04670 [Planctomycetales bacterium 4484_123]
MRSPELIKSVFRELERDGLIDRDSTILDVCAGPRERELFLSMGYRNVTISNLDDRLAGDEFDPCPWAYQDAQNLS